MVGGFASQLHGARRQTYDIDFVPAATEANDDRVAAACANSAPDCESPGSPTKKPANSLSPSTPPHCERSAAPPGPPTRAHSTSCENSPSPAPDEPSTNSDNAVPTSPSTALSSTSRHWMTSSTARPTPTVRRIGKRSPNSTTSAEQHATPEHPRRITHPHARSSPARSPRLHRDYPVSRVRRENDRSALSRSAWWRRCNWTSLASRSKSTDMRPLGVWCACCPASEEGSGTSPTSESVSPPRV